MILVIGKNQFGYIQKVVLTNNQAMISEANFPFDLLCQLEREKTNFAPQLNPSNSTIKPALAEARKKDKLSRPLKCGDSDEGLLA